MKTTLAVVVAVLASAPGLASAQEEIEATSAEAAPPAEETEVAKRADQAGTIKAIVRGLYVEARIGGGFMLSGAELPPKVRTSYPLAGDTEDLGGGALVHLGVGYDLTDMIALQAVGGATLVSGGGSGGLVRDLSMVFGGAGVRLAFAISSRLHALAEAEIAFVSADNSVESPKAGVAVLGGVGIEYFVHVRHFSLGLDLSVFAPTSPFRLFLGVAPTVKYTF